MNSVEIRNDQQQFLSNKLPATDKEMCKTLPVVPERANPICRPTGQAKDSKTKGCAASIGPQAESGTVKASINVAVPEPVFEIPVCHRTLVLGRFRERARIAF
jgi:hypothetical protein